MYISCNKQIGNKSPKDIPLLLNVGSMDLKQTYASGSKVKCSTHSEISETLPPKPYFLFKRTTL